MRRASASCSSESTSRTPRASRRSGSGSCAGSTSDRRTTTCRGSASSWSAARFTTDGWFRTGDIVTIDPRGYVEIQDRSKDLIKSGGEWISSVAIENALMGHPAVAEAAVIAVPHARWQERPLACVVFKPGCTATAEELRAFLAPSFAKWWLPDAFEFVTEIPKTAAGKFRKTALRERFATAREPSPAS